MDEKKQKELEIKAFKQRAKELSIKMIKTEKGDL